MSESPTSRLLQLLSLLQTHRFWSGRELADRLGVSGRTLRRDIERLRDLGYRLSSTRGSDGGYRLDAGADLPPLVLTNDEAVALAVALRTATAGPVVGLAETSVAVLAKLEQVLPQLLRARVDALAKATVVPTPIAMESTTDPDVLVGLAFACRDSLRVRLRYTAADNRDTERPVEPVALVPLNRRWYLVCWDLSRDDWRTLRVDRITRVTETRVPFVARRLPAPDAATFLERQFGEAPVHVAVVTINAPLEETSAYLNGYVRGLEADGPSRTRWRIQAERMETLAGALAWLPWPFTVSGSVEFEESLRRFSGALGRATRLRSHSA